jgi:hypothetical protein
VSRRPVGGGGGGTLLEGEGVGSPNSDEETDTVVLYVYMYFVPRAGSTLLFHLHLAVAQRRLLLSEFELT